MHAISSATRALGNPVWHPDVTVATIVARGDSFQKVEERIRGEQVRNQPAGHLEPNESLADAARRETFEETGWIVELEYLVGIYQWASASGEHFLRFAFAARALEHDPLRVLDTGIVRAVWLTRDEIATGNARPRSPMVLKGIDDWMSGRRWPLNALQTLAPNGSE